MSEMTATRMRRPLRLATLAAVAGVWAVAAFLLWDSTKVPGGLELGDVPRAVAVRRDIPPPGRALRAFFYWLALGQTVVTVVVFGSTPGAGRGSRASRPRGRSARRCCSRCSVSGWSGSSTVPFDVL